MTYISYRDSTMIVGCLTLRRGIPPRWSRVVAELLSHASSTTHHAWPCQMRLAAKAGCSVSTVKSCLRALRGWGLISVLPAATVAGLAAGPHRAAVRRGRHPVNVYDCSALIQIASEVLQPTSKGRPPLCDVRKNASSQSKSADSRFRDQKVDPIYKDRRRAARTGDCTAVSMLVGKGVWRSVAQRIVERRGAAWVLDCLRYVRLCAGVEDVPAYIVSVADRFEGWPDWMSATLERDRAARRRRVVSPPMPDPFGDDLPTIDPAAAQVILDKLLADQSIPAAIRASIQRAGIYSPLVRSRLRNTQF